MSNRKREANDSSLSLSSDSGCNGESSEEVIAKRAKIDSLDNVSEEKNLSGSKDEHLDEGSATKKEVCYCF